MQGNHQISKKTPHIQKHFKPPTSCSDSIPLYTQLHRIFLLLHQESPDQVARNPIPIISSRDVRSWSHPEDITHSMPIIYIHIYNVYIYTLYIYVYVYMYICIYSLYKSPWSRNQHFIEIPMKSPFFFAKTYVEIHAARHPHLGTGGFQLWGQGAWESLKRSDGDGDLSWQT